MTNSFQIFEKNTRLINPTKGNILFLIMAISLIILRLFENLNDYMKYPATISVIIYLIYHFTEFTRYKYVNGKFTGILTFNETNIIINERKIEISEIQKAYLRANDCEDDQREFFSRFYFETPKSNGTNNLLTLNLKTGEIIKTFFKIEYEEQLKMIKPFVISMIKNNIVTFDRACEFLNYNQDYEIELFEKELNKKEPE